MFAQCSIILKKIPYFSPAPHLQHRTPTTTAIATTTKTAVTLAMYMRTEVPPSDPLSVLGSVISVCGTTKQCE